MQTNAILGISMAPRRNRRLLVATASLLWLAAAYAVTLTGMRHFDLHALLITLLVPIAWRMFSSMVRQTDLPIPARREQQPITLLSKLPFQEPEPDERELSVRDRAYVISFRIIAVYVLLVFWFIAGQVDSGTPFSFRYTEWAVIPLVYLAFTLPPMVILWSEPDWPIEEEEFRSAESH